MSVHDNFSKKKLCIHAKVTIWFLIQNTWTIVLPISSNVFSIEFKHLNLEINWKLEILPKKNCD